MLIQRASCHVLKYTCYYDFNSIIYIQRLKYARKFIAAIAYKACFETIYWCWNMICPNQSTIHSKKQNKKQKKKRNIQTRKLAKPARAHTLTYLLAIID